MFYAALLSFTFSRLIKTTIIWACPFQQSDYHHFSSTSVGPVAWETQCAHLDLILYTHNNGPWAFPAVRHRQMQSSLWLISFLLTDLKPVESISLMAENPGSSVTLMSGPQFHTVSSGIHILGFWVCPYLLLRLCQGHHLTSGPTYLWNGT